MLRIIVFIFLFHSVCFGQMPKWIQGSTCLNSSYSLYTSGTNMLQFYEVDFSSGNPVFTQRTEGSSIANIVSVGLNEPINNGIDENGNISFYVFADCISPYNTNATDEIRFVAFDQATNADEVFATIPGNPTTASSVRNIEVIPMDGSLGFYYVIYKTACMNTLSPDDIRYVIVDMNTKTISASTVISSGSNNEGMGITKLDCTTNQRWLFFSKFSGGNFQIYRSSIGSSGISAASLVTSIALPGVASLGQGDLEISPDGTKLAIAMLCTSNANEDVLVYDLDNSTGALSNYRWINNPTNYIFSLEFSPDSQRLYMSLSGTSAVSNKLFNVGVPASNYTINASTDQIPVTLNSGLISMETGYDQKLYFNSSGYITSMTVITNPNSNALSNIITQTPANSYGAGNHTGYCFPDQIDGDFTTSSSSITLVASEDTICLGQNITLTASGGSNYSWSNGLSGSGSVQNVTPAATTTYAVSFSGTCGNGVDSVRITVLPNPVAQITENQEICEGEMVVLSGSGGTEYFWNGATSSSSQNTFVVSPLSTTTYSLIVSNGSCSSSPVDVTITVYPKPQLEILGDSLLCDGESAFFSANITSGTPAFTYLWSDGSSNTVNSFIPLTDQDLSLIVQDQFNCSDTAIVRIDIEPVPQADFQLNETGCSPLTVSIQNESVNATDFTWIFGDGTSNSQLNGNHTYLNSGIYSVTLIATNSACSDTLTISNPTEVIFTDHSSGSDSCVLFFGDETTVTDCNWMQLTHHYPSEGTYTVTQIVTNTSSGCTDTATYVLYLYGKTVFYVPNTFTPDGDEFNNLFLVVFPEDVVLNDFEFLIFDRWGEVLFESADYHVGWDGTYHSKLVQNGTYTWKLYWDDAKTAPREYVGHVNVLR